MGEDTAKCERLSGLLDANWHLSRELSESADKVLGAIQNGPPVPATEAIPPDAAYGLVEKARRTLEHLHAVQATLTNLACQLVG